MARTGLSDTAVEGSQTAAALGPGSGAHVARKRRRSLSHGAQPDAQAGTSPAAATTQHIADTAAPANTEGPARKRQRAAAQLARPDGDPQAVQQHAAAQADQAGHHARVSPHGTPATATRAVGPAHTPAVSESEPDRLVSIQLGAQVADEHDKGVRGGSAAAPPSGAKGAPVLPWMRVPLEIGAGGGVNLADVRGMAPQLRQALAVGGFQQLFPVQAAAWRALAGGFSVAHDLCICAPTGSGKTLAYALPLVNALAGQAAGWLQALVVLPTRDLAQQVFDVFAPLAAAVGLRVGLAAARASLVAEAAALTTGEGDSAVDILVATPGRLTAHCTATPGLGLAHLRFLVVDETDRLLRQAYQDWLPLVVAATESRSGSAKRGQLDAAAAAAAALLRLPGGAEDEVAEAGRHVVKVVVSATLTQDPAKVGRLALHAPRFIATRSDAKRYKLPAELQEFRVTCGAGAGKPAALLALLHRLRADRVLVFVSSVAATLRLFTMLAAAHGACASRDTSASADHDAASGGGPGSAELQVQVGAVAHYSSGMSAAARREALAAFRDGRVGILVASDAMTRGMDIEGCTAVVSYDAPVYAKTYVHRAGRTARAGAAGRAYTLLRREEVRHFKALLRKVDNAYVRELRLPPDHLAAARPLALRALARMQADLDGIPEEAVLEHTALDAITSQACMMVEL